MWHPWKNPHSSDCISVFSYLLPTVSPVPDTECGTQQGLKLKKYLLNGRNFFLPTLADIDKIDQKEQVQSPGLSIYKAQDPWTHPL